MMSPSLLASNVVGRFADDARQAVYEALALRRDIRHFDGSQAVNPEALQRVLEAAHQAPSVGFSQPWGFVLVDDVGVRQRIRESFLRCREREAARFPEERRKHYLATRLEGIVDAPLNICVAVDLRPRDEAILGTTVQPESVRASAICAVQNLWIAARVEGLGVGWVSIVEPQVLRAELALPAGVEPVAYLCLGHPKAFRDKPMLEETGWLPRRPLEEVVHRASRWKDPPAPEGSRPGEKGRRPEAVPRSGQDASLGDTPSALLADAASSPSAAQAGDAGFLTSELRSERGLWDALRLPWSGGAPRLDDSAVERTKEHQKLLTKPIGSLGRLEELAAWYAGVTGEFPARVPTQVHLAIFAADHGVAREGVSAYGSQVTAAMVATLLSGGAAANVLARERGLSMVVVDAGVAGDLSMVPLRPVVPFLRRPLRAGTGNLRRERAMEVRDVEAALALGASVAKLAIEQGASLLIPGEVGIGNTTAAAAIICTFTASEPQDVVGRGTGMDDVGLREKVQVVRDALSLHRPDPSRPHEVAAAVGGLELVAMAGYMLQGAKARVPVILDGFLSAAAALLAQALEPGVEAFFLASHVSAERGATRALAKLGLRPLFDLGLRLGEGTGAILAVDLVRSALRLPREMATFATAGIVGRAGADLPDGAP